IDNNILRPDCYFKLHNHTLTSFSNLTVKELRKAHNLEKMYRAGSFNGIRKLNSETNNFLP
ncbi:hypothetical protein V7124_07675, partial [Neobacillus niacini]